MDYPPLWTASATTEWVDKQLEVCRNRYRIDGQPQSVTFRDLCRQWGWAKRSDVYTHLLHRYPAKLLAYIPIFFLSSTYAEMSDLVLDPFAGTGTVLLESISHPYSPRNCYGVEINPLARLIAKVKTTPLSPEILQKRAEQLYRLMREFQNRPPIPEFPSSTFWFRSEVLEDIAKARICIERMDATLDERDFLLACLSSIIRDVSWADPKVAPPVKLRADKFPKTRQPAIEQMIAKKSTADVLTCLQRAINKNMARMKQFYEMLDSRPVEHRARVEIIWDDVRSLARGTYVSRGDVSKHNAESIDGQVGLVITSPPYINAQKYIRTTKLELWCLGLESQDSITNLDKSLIGTEKVFSDEYRELIPVGNSKADQLLVIIHKTSPRQAGIVSRYFRDMRLAMQAIHRVLKPGGYFVMVVGDNRVCNQIVENHKILAEIAQENNGFTVESILVDTIRSRGIITKRHATAGVIPEEWVLVMRKYPVDYLNGQGEA